MGSQKVTRCWRGRQNADSTLLNEKYHGVLVWNRMKTSPVQSLAQRFGE